MAAIIKSPQKLESDVFMVSGYDGEQEAFAFDKTELSLSQIRNRGTALRTVFELRKVELLINVHRLALKKPTS